MKCNIALIQAQASSLTLFLSAHVCFLTINSGELHDIGNVHSVCGSIKIGKELLGLGFCLSLISHALIVAASDYSGFCSFFPLPKMLLDGFVTLS